MEQYNKEYKLDFIIPQGPTGPQGIEGATGPIGPASLGALLFTEFNTTSKKENLEINKNIILPNSTNVFVPKNNEIDINEPGNYEFTISGILGGLSSNEVLSVNMIITNEDGNSYSVMLASIVAETKQEYFSQTMLITFQQKQTIKILFNKNDFYSNSAIESATLLIKKLAL